MTSLDPELGMLRQRNRIESIVMNTLNRLRRQFGVPVPELNIRWEENEFNLSLTASRIQGTTLYLSKQELVVRPYNIARRKVPITLEIGTPEGKKVVTFPYGKLLDLLGSTPSPNPFSLKEESLTDGQIAGEVTQVVVRDVLEKLSSWLANDLWSARCMRNGIVSSYEHLVKETTPTPLSNDLWKSDDPGVHCWLETNGGFFLLYPYLKDYFRYDEIIERFEQSGPPTIEEDLPRYMSRTLSPL